MLPRGDAKKVTIYLNQDTRAHVDPLWSAILGFLRHRHVAGATLLRADAGFGSHEQLHDPLSEYGGEHLSVRLEFVETPARVDELLPNLYEMVTDGLITVQDVTVVKSASKDAKHSAREKEIGRKVSSGPAKLVRIYLGESDKCKDEPLYEAIVKRLQVMGFSGATVYRGILGYGAKRRMHKAGRFNFSHDLPIMISVVERPEKAIELVQAISGMMQDGIIVTSDVELYQFARQMPGDSDAA